MTYSATNVTGMVNTAVIACSADTSAPYSSNIANVTFRTVGAWKIQGVRANLVTGGTGTTTIDIKNGASSIFGTVPAIGTGLTTSVTGTGSSNGTLTGGVPYACSDDQALAIYCTNIATNAQGLKVSVFYCL